MEGVVLNRVCILGIFCPKQGQGFKPSAAHLYSNIGRVPPPPPPPPPPPTPYPEHETFNLLFLNKKATSRQDSWAHNVLNKSYSTQLLYDTRLNVTIELKDILETQ